MKKSLALILCIIMLLPLLFACKEENHSGEVPQRIYITDGGELYKRLYSLFVSDGDDNLKAQEAQNILNSLKNWEYEGSPAGGAGFEGKIYTEGDYTVTTDDQFKAALKSAKEGEVIFIPSGAVIDLSDLSATESYTAKIPKGVIIASDRGIGEGGVLKFSHQSGTLLVCGDNVTITGINLCGVMPIFGKTEVNRGDNGIRIDGTGINVSNCEIASFSKSGITVFPDAVATVSHCFIHNCETGVAGREKAEVTLEDNLFFANGCHYNTDKDDSPALPEGNYIATEKQAEAPLIEQTEPDITIAFFPSDVFETCVLLEKIAAGQTELITDALSVHAGTTNYYYYKDKISITKDGTVYGVKDFSNPLGGGKGYTDIITEGDYTVTDTASLVNALKTAKSGETVFIPNGVKIGIAGLTLTVPEGVTLASDRGRVLEDGTVSKGGMIYVATRQTECLVLSQNSVFTGITLAGADTERHMTHLQRGLNSAGTSYTDYYYSLILARGLVVRGDNVTVSNCEISGFSEAGVLVEGFKGIKVSHCYIHHNQRNGFGYGVALYRQAEVEIYGNLFNFDRHAIAADGSAGSSYYAHDNIHMGTAIYHIFDAHGGTDRGDGTDVACDKVEMLNNVFLSDRLPYKKRGTPTEYSLFKHNIVIYPEDAYEYRFLYGNNFTIEDNLFGIANKEKPVYDFEGARSYLLDMTSVEKYEGVEYIDSATQKLRYKYILVFAPAEDGKFYIKEYGNNLDDGSIRNWNEKVYVPEGGFVIAFTADNGSGVRLYNAVAERHGVIYNTTLCLDGDFVGEFDGELLRVYSAKINP
ncbi:MAG: right-handed parallel beta-helix repeat-containing protein [Clostridia bacterium]|nr:right-handed parallel beta-helix repeat-containing protein [Clostridia bacterium]